MSKATANDLPCTPPTVRVVVVDVVDALETPADRLLVLRIVSRRA